MSTLQVHTTRLSAATAAAIIVSVVSQVCWKNGLRYHLTSNERDDDYVLGSDPRRMSLHSKSKGALAWDWQFEVRVRMGEELKWRWCTDNEHRTIGKQIAAVIGDGWDVVTHKTEGDARAHCHTEYDP